MQYQYDSYNRIQRMTYPDGEVVSYGYNRGGMLESVLGNKNGVSSDYIKEIRYNKYELKDSVSYGNGTSVRYLYDSLLRLSHLRSECADGVMQDIDYDYDSVSNITNIANSAPMMPNGLGGTYSQSFSYDNLYRLTGSSGIWAGSDSLDYHTETEYHANGRIKQKQVTAKVLSNGHVSQISYDNGYYYDNLQQPNTLSRISAPEVVIPGISFRNGKDRSSSPVVHFSWDATGNMVSQDPAGDAGRRFLCWDEQNRLQGVVDGKHLSYYLYDANGDRTFKLTGKGDLQNISGTWQYYYLLENATLYASPYLVATYKGYTKHYYAESERIASKIGGGGLTELGIPLYNDDAFIKKMKDNNTMMDKVLKECLNAKYYEVKPVLQHLYDWQDSVQPEDNCYWYHPDHLGSSSWITHTNGHTVQHLHYLPWGEDFINQKLSGFDGVRFTFSAKERDSETGLSYFGSRYYSSDLSIWLSVDPMSDKYPSLSPYTYCADNPVKLVDPNGEEVCDGGDPSSKRLRRFYDYFDKKIRAPLMKMVEDGANDDDLEAAADYLCNKYQKRLLKGYNRAVNGMGRIEKINVEVFSETEEKIEIESRPDNQEMIVCGEIPIGANVYAVEIDFNPYGVENYATFIAANKVETGWINSPEGNSFSYDLEVDGAGPMTYCIQNRLIDKRQDNWSFSVTMRSRRLVIRPELRISNCRSRKKIVRKR